MIIHIMKQRKGLIAFMGFCVGSVIFLGLRGAGIEQAAAQSGPTLALEISSPTRRLLRHEPAQLDLTFRNPGQDATKWYRPYVLGSGVTFLIARNGGTERRLNGEDYYGRQPSRIAATTPAGARESMSYLLDERIADLIFENRGHYRLRLEFEYADLSLGTPERRVAFSNAIDFDVQDAQGPDREALDYIRSVLIPACQQSNPEEELRIRQFFSNNFANSVYWKYKTFELANVYLERGQYQSAEDEFYRISDLDFFYSKDVAKGLQRLAAKLGRATPRTRRPFEPTNAPIAVPISTAPTAIIHNPPPSNAPVPIPIPAPSP